MRFSHPKKMLREILPKRNVVTLIAANLLAVVPLCQAEISLLELPVKEYKVGFGDLWIGRNLDKRKVTVQGKETEDYLFAHASSRVKYDIPAGVSRFEAWGVRTNGDENVFGSWFYIVKIDGKEVFRSKPLVDYETYEIPISVEIPAGSKELELVIDNMTNGFADHSIWALPKFK
ncbi:MAG: NPCBM/NEW2 domain-containing protein [Terrimicrobiaceae bacterium]|nr:NPCBM/NEW2 domain-containing protein [Terrimicrobiaceae bacterium]